MICDVSEWIWMDGGYQGMCQNHTLPGLPTGLSTKMKQRAWLDRSNVPQLTPRLLGNILYVVYHLV